MVMVSFMGTGAVRIGWKSSAPEEQVHVRMGLFRIVWEVEGQV
jgi:hypothetical protein